MHPGFRLGNWIVRPQRGYIERGRKKVHIQPKPMAVLERLAAADGEVVTRDELFEAVWPGVIVSDDALAQCVMELRKSFGDVASEPRIIRTIPRVGYHLVPQVRALRDASLRARTGLRWTGLVVLLLAVVITALVQFIPSAGTPTRGMAGDEARSSIAVLPFVNRSPLPENRYFSDGMHDELLSRLAMISGLRVISRTSVERYRDTDKSLPEIGRELSVATVLEGGVQRTNDQVRVNVQLIDARTDRHLWAKTFDRQLTSTNIFLIQTEVATKIADLLEVTLTPEEEARVASIPTYNYEAYEALLRGHRALRNGTQESMYEAVGFYKRALELHPGFAQAYLAIANAYNIGIEELGIPETEARQRIVESAWNALQLDTSLGSAYMYLGWNERRSGQFAEAEKYYLRGIELEPGNSVLLHSFGLTLRLQGRALEALRYYDDAFRLDPLSPLINESRGSLLRDLGQFEEAEKQYRNALLIDPEFALTHWGLGTLYWSVGQPERAFEWFENAVRLRPYSDTFWAWLALMHLELGQDEQAKSVIEGAMDLTLPEENDIALIDELRRIYRGQEVSGVPDGRQFLLRRLHGSLVDLPSRALMVGDYRNALDDYASACPGIAEGQAEINGFNYRAAIYVAHALQQLGRHEAISQLLEQVDAFISDPQRQRLGIHGYWVSDVQIQVIRGDHEAALASLQRAVDEGWRNLWRFYLLHDPVLAALHGESGFRDIVATVEQDMRERVAKP
jgi:TolB-like protein/DNA-binding winged helix-turn-helix (wHTH) protein/tetratricopeptide (TPR) repeat protein